MTNTQQSTGTLQLNLLHFSEHAQQANAVAQQLGIACRQIELHRFPDQEARVTIPIIDSDRVAIYLSLDHPDPKLIELMLACATLREAGVQSIMLVAPYLCYMRQDIAFAPGQAVSQRIIGKFLASMVDALMTVDPHLHRTVELNQAVPVARAITLSSTALQAAYISQHYQDALLLGPDQESEQWVRRIAAASALDYIIADKQRLGDRSVQIEIPEADIAGRRVLLIDDMASTGQTLAQCARILRQRQAQQIDALVTHALFTREAEQQLKDAGINTILSTDSIPHPSNRISLATLLADALRDLA